MKVILFGATGMVGQGVLRECILDRGVTAVLCVVRPASAGILSPQSAKVRELMVDDFYDLSSVRAELAGYDACLFAVGVSALGLKEAEYRRVTYELTLAVARCMLQTNPASTFLYVSGAGTEVNSRQMWARVKGATEQALLGMGFPAAYMFRPGAIVPLDGIRSKTGLYRAIYRILTPVLPMLLRRFPRDITTTRQVGRAMLAVSRRGYSKAILESADIARAAE